MTGGPRRLSLNVTSDVKRMLEEMAARQGSITAAVVSSVRLRRYFDERAKEGWRPALVKGDVVREVMLP